MVGFFFTGSAIIGILVSQFLAGRSDRKGDRKSLIVFCCLLGVFACVLFAWNRNYFILLFVGVFLSSSARPPTRRCSPLPASMPTAPGGSGDVQLDTARAGVACVGDWPRSPTHWQWVLAFTVMYLSAAVAFVVCGAMVWFFLPSMRKEPKVATGTLEAPRRNRRDALLLFIICTLMGGTNSLYIINMPLFIIDELHLPEKLAGIMMGTAAGLEIPPC